MKTVRQILLFTVTLVVVIVCGPGRLQAHTRSESHARYDISGSSVDLTISLTEAEIERLLPLIAIGTGEKDPSEHASPTEIIGAYIQTHWTVESGSDTGIKQAILISGPKVLAASAGYKRFELLYRCASEKGITLKSSAFCDLVPSHVCFVDLHKADGTYAEQLFTADHTVITLDGGNTLQSASFWRYIWLGILHILTGPDHIAFLIGLLLISRSFRDLAFVITGFTIGHSITLAISVLGYIRPHGEFVDVLIAVTIGVIGAENIAVALGRSTKIAVGVGVLTLTMAALRLIGIGHVPALLLLGVGLFSSCFLLASPHIKDAARLRLVVTLVFGLVHGFAFAGDLIEMHLPRGRMVQLLTGFNLGVEAGQLLVVVLLSGVVALLVQRKWALPRPLAVDALAASLVALSVYWLISRTYA